MFALDEEGAPMPEELLDARLLARFPGRTLEEIDRIDLPRHLRAWAAEVYYEQAKTWVAYMRGEERREAASNVPDAIQKELTALWRQKRELSK